MLRIVENCLEPMAFAEIREKVGFPPYSLEDTAAALKNTLYTVEIRNEEMTVGIARIIGDNRIVFFIKDVVVDPNWRGRGLGRMLMEALFGYIRQHACKNAYVGLMATQGTERFYERFGFIRRPAPGLGSGMVLYMNETTCEKV